MWTSLGGHYAAFMQVEQHHYPWFAHEDVRAQRGETIDKGLAKFKPGSHGSKFCGLPHLCPTLGIVLFLTVIVRPKIAVIDSDNVK